LGSGTGSDNLTPAAADAPAATPASRRYLKAAAALVILGAAAAASVRVVNRAPSVQVSTEAVTVGPIVRSIVALGTVQPLTTVEVGAQVSGTLQSIAVDYNAPVRAGQVLARFEPAAFDASLAQAQAALAQARADEGALETAQFQARMQLERAEALAEQELIAQADLDAARTAVNQAAADVAEGLARIDQEQAAVEQATVDLGHTVIRAPVDGIVLERDVDAGQTVSAALQSPVLFRIATDLRRVQVQATIDESDIGGVKTGGAVTVQVDAYPGETFKGVVSQLRLQPATGDKPVAPAPAAPLTAPPSAPSGTVVGYPTMIDVDNAEQKLRPGMTATVVLRGNEREQVIRLPNNALLFRPSQDLLSATGSPVDRSGPRSDDEEDSEVWRFDGTTFTPINVTTGLADDAWTELLRGPLESGDLLVTSARLKSAR